MATKDRDRIRRLREEANQIRKQEEARKRRSRLFTQLAIVLGALVVVGLIAMLVIMGPKWFGNQNTPETVTGEVPVAKSDGTETKMPITVGENGVTVGKADAPVTIDYYFDFSCPHCIEYHAGTQGMYNDVVAKGEAKINYHMIQYVAPYGKTAGAALYSAVERQPELFYKIVDGIFAVPAQEQMGYGPSDYATLLTGFGVTNQDAIESAKKGEYSWFVGDATEKARVKGVPGTPSVYVNGQLLENLPTTPEALEAAIKGEPVPAPTKPGATEQQSTPSESARAE